MGVREQPITRVMIYGKLRRYKCRVCGLLFREPKPPESSKAAKHAELPRQGQHVGGRRRQKVDSRQTSMF